MKITHIRHASIPNPKSPPAPATIPLPKRVVLSLESPWGQAVPLVQTGQQVQAGQCIAQGKDLRVLPVHASVSGTVAEIRKWADHSGKEVLSISIQSDGAEEPVKVEAPGREDDPAHIFQRILAAGINEIEPRPWPLGLRIASPGLVAEFVQSSSPALNTPIETLIVNGMDRQPGVFVRRAVFGYAEEDLIEGVSFLQKVTSASRTVLAVAQDQSLSGELQQELSSLRVQIVRCPDKFPLALEPLLAQFVTKKEVPQPANDTRLIGTVVVDVEAVLSVTRAVRDGVPPMERVIQVDAPALELSKLVRVRNGMLMEELIEHLSSTPEKPAKVIIGGLFMGQAQYTLQVPVTQETDSILFQNLEELSRSSNEACINCGYCVRYCPMKLLPNELGKYCEYGKFDDAEAKFLFNCIECGLCAYVCPARRPMVQLLRFGKHQLSLMREAS